MTLFPAVASAAWYSDILSGDLFGDATITRLDQWAATTSPTTAITQRVFGNAVYLSGLNTSGATRCLQISSAGIVQVASAACGSGGGGSGGGTWATTTSNVAGQNINYPLENDDIVTIGSTATTTARFYFDPNTLTSVFNGALTLPYLTATTTSTSTLPRLSSTGFSTTWLCLTGDICRTTWPTGGGSSSVGPLNVLQASDGSGGFIATGTNSLSADRFIATSSTVASVFPYASTTAFTASGEANIGTLVLSNALTVANGGTGAATLTGCLTGNGTAAITGSGTCNTSNATVSSVATTWPVIGGTITTSGTLSFGGLSTSSPIAAGAAILYATGVNTIASAATGTIGVSGGITVTAAQYIIGSGLTIGCTTATASAAGCISAASFSKHDSATTTFSTGLTYLSGNVTCDTASASVFGCLTAASFSKFNSATSTFSSPLVYTTATNAVTCPTCNTSNATVSSIATNAGLTGGTITTTGTLGLDTTAIVNGLLLQYNGTRLQATGTPALTVGYVIATTSIASQLPYASTTAITVGTDLLPPFHAFSATVSSSTAILATTTQRLVSPANITVDGARCETDTGTLGVSLYDGTNRANYIPTASSTTNYNAYTTNNTFTTGESIRVDFGTPASSPTYGTCTFIFRYTSL